MITFDFLKASLCANPSQKNDSFLNSPVYYSITGRKGACLYKNSHSALITCNHPHIDNRILVFPEMGKASYELTASVLNMIEHPDKHIQLARYSANDITRLKHQLANLNYTPVSGISMMEENIMDWRYPLHILDTHMISDLQGALFSNIRNKFNRAASNTTTLSLDDPNALRSMKAVLKFWEGNMIFNSKETPDMSEFYLKFFKLLEEHPEDIDGLIFLNGRKPVGFSVWDKPDYAQAANLFVNLSDTSIAGLSDFQIVSTCRNLHEKGVRYLNTGGSELKSLDAFKAKYNPVVSEKILSADVFYTKQVRSDIQVHQLI